jgi:hypothetical protein
MASLVRCMLDTHTHICIHTHAHAQQLDTQYVWCMHLLALAALGLQSQFPRVRPHCLKSRGFLHGPIQAQEGVEQDRQGEEGGVERGRGAERGRGSRERKREQGEEGKAERGGGGWGG